MQRGSSAKASPAEAKRTAQTIPVGTAQVKYLARMIERGETGATCRIQSELPSSETEGNTNREQIDRIIRELIMMNENIAIRSHARNTQVPTRVGAEIF
jgi:hypothetical protein